MRAWLTALGLLALVAAAPARAAPEVTGEVTSLGGGTIVAVDGTTVTIIVHIDICCFDDVGTTLAAHIMNEVRAAQDMWNKALAKLPAHGCFDVKVVFDARLQNLNDPWDPGYHHIRMYFDQPGRSFVYVRGEQNDDVVSGYVQTSGGHFFASDMTTAVYAHEIGHMMGLGDDYYEQGDAHHKRGDCLDGRGNSLMCGKNGNGEITQGLADRLADILNKLGVLPQCWKGTLQIASNFKSPPWSDTWKADLRVLIDARGKASGSGVNRRASPVRGRPIGATPVQEFPFGVSGDADHVRLRLTFHARCCGVPAGSGDFSRMQVVLFGTLNENVQSPRTYAFAVTAPGVAKLHFDYPSDPFQAGSIDGQLECATCAAFGSKQ